MGATRVGDTESLLPTYTKTIGLRTTKRNMGNSIRRRVHYACAVSDATILHLN